MFEAFIAWDDRTFRLVNGAWQHPTLDVLLPFMTDLANFIPLAAVLAVSLVVWGGLRGRRFVVTAVVTVLVADAVSTYLFKYTILRLRPCNALEGVRLLVGCTASPSFPSNHAVNMSALATLVALYARPLLIPAAAAAVTVAYSRVYVGVHYPLDVLAGCLLGIAVAFALSQGIIAKVSGRRSAISGQPRQ